MSFRGGSGKTIRASGSDVRRPSRPETEEARKTGSRRRKASSREVRIGGSFCGRRRWRHSRRRRGRGECGVRTGTFSSARRSSCEGRSVAVAAERRGIGGCRRGAWRSVAATAPHRETAFWPARRPSQDAGRTTTDGRRPPATCLAKITQGGREHCARAEEHAAGATSPSQRTALRADSRRRN